MIQQELLWSRSLCQWVFQNLEMYSFKETKHMDKLLRGSEGHCPKSDRIDIVKGHCFGME